MALFNELYFLVDGGSFWEHGEVGGPDPGPDDIGRFALLECVDYPFYDTVDVDFYASFALLERLPGAGARGIRDLLAAIPVDDPRSSRSRRPGAARRARSAGPSRTTSAARMTTRSSGRTGTASRTSTTGRTSARSSSSRPGATRWPPAPAGRRADPGRLAHRRGRADPAVDVRPRWRWAARARRAAGPDLRHLADARPVGVRRLALAGGRRRGRGDGPAAGRRRGGDPLGRAGSSAARSPSTGGCGAATTTPTTAATARARTASWPTSSRASGTPTRPASATSCRRERVEAALRTIHRSNVRGSPAGGWARSTARARTAPSTPRASSRPRSGSGRPTPWRRS